MRSLETLINQPIRFSPDGKPAGNPNQAHQAEKKQSDGLSPQEVLVRVNTLLPIARKTILETAYTQVVAGISLSAITGATAAIGNGAPIPYAVNGEYYQTTHVVDNRSKRSDWEKRRILETEKIRLQPDGTYFREVARLVWTDKPLPGGLLYVKNYGSEANNRKHSDAGSFIDTAEAAQRIEEFYKRMSQSATPATPPTS